MMKKLVSSCLLGALIFSSALASHAAAATPMQRHERREIHRQIRRDRNMEHRQIRRDRNMEHRQIRHDRNMEHRQIRHDRREMHRTH